MRKILHLSYRLLKQESFVASSVVEMSSDMDEQDHTKADAVRKVNIEGKRKLRTPKNTQNL